MDRVGQLANYVWSRPAGEPAQEVGGVLLTLAAYCNAHDLDMQAAGETELSRVWGKVEAIRAKQAAKPAGSALPQKWELPTPSCATPGCTNPSVILFNRWRLCRDCYEKLEFSA